MKPRVEEGDVGANTNYFTGSWQSSFVFAHTSPSTTVKSYFSLHPCPLVRLFGWYVLHLGRFSMVYGSLSTLAVFFLWIYYSSAILILGEEVAFLLEKKNDRTHG